MSDAPVQLPKGDQVAEALQKVLPELLALQALAKQAHWNVRGAGFLPCHELLDDLHQDAEDAADFVAERIVQFGKPADGQPETVAKARLASLPSGFISTDQAFSLLGGRTQAVVGLLRAACETIDAVDEVTDNSLQEIIAGLEKKAWFLLSHTYKA